MAIKKTRQRQRGGPYSKFDKTKTLPREFQIVESGDPNTKDGRAVYIAFEAGEPKRLSTYEDMQEDIDNATEEIQGTLTSGVDKKIKEADAAITSAKSAATKANTATTNANTATDSANKAADNANKAVENIQSKVAINDKQPSATTAYSGNKIETEFLKKNGDSSETTVTFEVATQRANIQPQDTLEIAFGKLAKFCGDLKSHAFAAPVNNLAGTNPDLALAAPMGKELKGEIDALNSALTLVETELKSGDGNYFDSNTKSFCYKIMDSAYVLVINTGIIGGTIANGNNAIMLRNLPYTWKYDNRIPATLSTGEGILLFGKKGENVVRLGSEHRNIEVGTRICSNAIIPKNFINI